MKINRYECDICGIPVANNREYKITVKFPVPETVKVPDRWDRNKRKAKSIDLCQACFEERFGTVFAKIMKGEEDD